MKIVADEVMPSEQSLEKNIGGMKLFHCFFKDEIDVSEFKDFLWSGTGELGDALNVGNGEGAIDERTMKKEHFWFFLYNKILIVNNY